MAYYLDLLPRDLLNLLSCFLNIKQIDILCLSPKINYLCKTDDIWRFKIDHEFPYIPIQYLRSSLLSPKLKYIELKSIRDVDYDSDYFITENIYVRRASRLADRNMSEDLLGMYTKKSLTIQFEGAAYRNDQGMFKRLLRDVGPSLVPSVERIYAANIQVGYTEAHDFDTFIVVVHQLFVSDVTLSSGNLFLNSLKGVIASGDVTSLHKYESNDRQTKEQIVAELSKAASSQKWNMVDYIIDTYLNDNTINGHIRQSAYLRYLGVLVELWENDRFISITKIYNNIFYYSIYDILEDICKSGNIPLLEYIIKNKFITLNDLNEHYIIHMYALLFTYNHLDMAEYMQKYIPLNAELVNRLLSIVSLTPTKMLNEIATYLKSLQ